MPGSYGMLQRVCRRLKRPALSCSSLVVVLASLVLLTYSPILHEIVHVIFLCACVKSSVESSRYLASIVVDRRSMTRPELRAVILQSLGSLCLNSLLPRRVTESLGAANVLLRAAEAARRLHRSDVARRLLEMGNTLKSYVSAPESRYTHFADDACVLVTSGRPLVCDKLDEAQAAVPPIEKNAAFCDAASECSDVEEGGGAVACEVGGPSLKAGADTFEQAPVLSQGRGPTAATSVSTPENEPRLGQTARSMHRESILTLEEFLE